ncbi:MAG: LicD family protein [Candidatus Omnitrophica bacterium ADurb.Bin292]|nr:MAG: LicD family protein [Candidatus Omnitrophica bacterium ADurb.Bin292]
MGRRYDIALCRDDYERLIDLLKQGSGKYFLQDHSTEKHYVFPYAKLRLNDTAAVEKTFECLKINAGVFVDIFPLDRIKIPPNYLSNLRRLVIKLITCSIFKKEGVWYRRVGLKKLVHIPEVVLALLPKKWLIRMQRLLGIRSGKGGYAILCDPNYSIAKTYYTEEELSKRVQLPFEDMFVWASATWDKALKRTYNNYMTLPPEDKRDSGHEFSKIVLNGKVYL